MRAVIRAMLDDMPDPCDLHLERAADHPRAPAGRSLQVQVTRIRHVIQHRPYHCPHAAPYHGFNNYAAQSARKNPRSPGTQLNRFRRSEAATYDAIFDDLSSLITRSGRVRPLFRLDRVAAHPDPRVYEVVSNQIVASLRHCQSMAPDTFSAIRKSLPRDVRELGEMPIKFPEFRAAVFKWEGRRPRGRWGRRRVVRSLRGVSAFSPHFAPNTAFGPTVAGADTHGRRGAVCTRDKHATAVADQCAQQDPAGWRLHCAMRRCDRAHRGTVRGAMAGL